MDLMWDLAPPIRTDFESPFVQTVMRNQRAAIAVATFNILIARPSPLRDALSMV